MLAQAPLIAQLISCDFSTIERGDFQVPPHLHHFHQLDVILAGEVAVGLNETKPFVARRGHALLVPPLCLHSYVSQHGFQQAAFKFHLAPGHWSHFGNKPIRTQLAEHLLKNFEDAGRRDTHNAPLGQQHAACAATLGLMALLDTQPATEITGDVDSRFHADLWRLLEAIENRPHENWTVAALARQCHLSPDHFSRCFHRLLQRTPQHYLLEARMRAAAAELMKEPSRPIKQIAEQCGYASVHSFHRAFHRVFQCGPAAYRHAPRDL